MTAPHFRQNAAIAARFDALAKNPRNAVSFALASGYSVERGDVDLSCLEEYEELTDVAARLGYAAQHRARLAIERSALTLIEHQGATHARIAEEEAQRIAARRRVFIEGRTKELFDAWLAERRAEFAIQAGQEFDVKQAEPEEAPEPEPEAQPIVEQPRARARRTA
jgi:hypothetical protein